MMSSQLGRLILDTSAASIDEMTAAPDSAGQYGPMDSLLGELALRIRLRSSSNGDRRPEELSSTVNVVATATDEGVPTP